MIGRKKLERTRGQLMRDELAESYDHLRLAAAHAAGGTAARVAPTYGRARTIAGRGVSSTAGAAAPWYQQAKLGAASARTRRSTAQRRRRRMPALVGLLAAGAAVGAAGAVITRRRRSAPQWDEYEPIPSASDTANRDREAGVGDTSIDRPPAGRGTTPGTATGATGAAGASPSEPGAAGKAGRNTFSGLAEEASSDLGTAQGGRHSPGGRSPNR